MPVPYRINDGNWSVAAQAGAHEVDTPFADEGDTSTFILTVPFMQDQANYVPLRNFLNPVTGLEQMVPYTALGRTVYLVKETTARPVDMTSGLLKFSRVYAPIPRTRRVRGSIVYPYQFVSLDGTQAGEIPLNVDCRIIYEYSLGAPLASLKAPKVAELFGRIYLTGGWAAVAAGADVLAQDSESRIWMGQIYERKSIYITQATFTNP